MHHRLRHDGESSTVRVPVMKRQVSAKAAAPYDDLAVIGAGSTTLVAPFSAGPS